jgi:hypothetical protein
MDADWFDVYGSGDPVGRRGELRVTGYRGQGTASNDAWMQGFRVQLQAVTCTLSPVTRSSVRPQLTVIVPAAMFTRSNSPGVVQLGPVPASARLTMLAWSGLPSTTCQ